MNEQTEKEKIDGFIKRDSEDAKRKLFVARVKVTLVFIGLPILAVAAFVAAVAVVNQLEKDANNGHFAGEPAPEEVVSDETTTEG